MQPEPLLREWTPISTELTLDNYDIRKFRPDEIANELTVINRSLLLNIRREEFFDFAFLSTRKEVFAPNITLMLDFFDRTSALFATQILRQRTDHLRAAVIIHLFLVVRHLYIKNHDIHSIRIVFAAFDEPSVFRLRETWRVFRLEQSKFYTALKYLWNVLSQENNWQEYRLWVEHKLIKDCLAKNQPVLLFIGYLLTKMIIDRYAHFQLPAEQENRTALDSRLSSRVNRALVRFVQSSPRRLE